MCGLCNTPLNTFKRMIVKKANDVLVLTWKLFWRYGIPERVSRTLQCPRDHTLRNSGRCFETPLKASISSTDFSLKCSLENDEPAVWHWPYRTYWQVVKLCKGLHLTLLLIPSISVNSKHKNDVATKHHCRKTTPSHPQPPYPMTSLSIPLSTHGIALTCLSNRSWADPEISEKWKVVPFLKRVGEYIKYTLLILITKYKQGLKKIYLEACRWQLSILALWHCLNLVPIK